MVQIRDVVGRAAAGTLGFIVGDVPGAFMADKAYRSYQKNFGTMAPVKRKASDASSVGRPAKKAKTSGSSSTSSRRGSMASTVSMSSSRSGGVGRTLVKNFSKADSTNSRTYAIKKKSEGVKKEGVKKTTPVPPKLRKQVKQILKGSDNYGFMMENYAFKYTPNTFGQTVIPLGALSQNETIMFDPCYVGHCASVLFNQKASTAAPTVSDAGTFTYKNLKVNVITQTSTFRLKNNTARIMYIKLYETSPKNRANTTNGLDFATAWTQAMVDEAGSGGVGEPARINLSNSTPQTLYATPYMSPAVRANHTIDQTSIILEPGKEYVYTMTGPNMEYKFDKYFTADGTLNGLFVNEQKFIRHLTAVVYYDMIATSLGTASRKTDIVVASSYGLLVEQTKFIKISMPEVAGFNPAINPVAGTAIPLTNRKPRPYVINDWTATGLTGSVGVISDETPNAPASAGV